ncbi:hypothetical protein ABPG77_005975 [Micractinium sp. CCAP 211/92]
MDGALMTALGRRLLSDCNVMGSVGVGGSIALLLLIGFAVGAGLTGLFFWWRERRRMRIELEYRTRYGDAVRSGLPDVSAMVKAAHTPTISRSAVGGALPAGEGVGAGAPGATAKLLSKAASALADGPLAMGAVSSFKQDPVREALAAKEQHPNHHTNPLAGGPTSMARSSSGNPFSGEVPSFCVRTNDACSLNNTPASSINGLPLSARIGSPEGPRQAGLIGTGVYVPAADPSSPRITQPAGTEPGAGPPALTPSPFGLTGAPSGTATGAPGLSQQQRQPTHARSDTVVVRPASKGGEAAAAVPVQAVPTQAPQFPPGSPPAGRSSDYLAALDSTSTNPFETPALRRQREEESGAAAFAVAATAVPTLTQAAVPGGSSGGAAAGASAAAAAKAAQKQELLQAVREEEYEAEELDPEWGHLLGDLDSRLQAAGRPRLSARERAVAIRSLIVATASQSADAALAKAQGDVEAFRRVQPRVAT